MGDAQTCVNADFCQPRDDDFATFFHEIYRVYLESIQVRSERTSHASVSVLPPTECDSGEHNYPSLPAAIEQQTDGRAVRLTLYHITASPMLLGHLL